MYKHLLNIDKQEKIGEYGHKYLYNNTDTHVSVYSQGYISANVDTYDIQYSIIHMYIHEHYMY